MICVCGANCGNCPHYKKNCDGCDVLAGKVFWTQYIGADVCPIYKCVNDKAYKNCGDCPEIPCQLWLSLKDPSWTDEQHQKSIQDRLAVLKGQ